MNKYRLLLFDLDGTLADTDEMVVQSFYSLYKRYKPKVVRTREELYYFSGPPIRETLKNEFPDYDQKEMHDAFKTISRDFYAPYVTAYEDEIDAVNLNLIRTSRLTVSSRPSLAIEDGLIPDISIRSFFFILRSMRSLNSLR